MQLQIQVPIEDVSRTGSYSGTGSIVLDESGRLHSADDQALRLLNLDISYTSEFHDLFGDSEKLGHIAPSTATRITSLVRGFDEHLVFDRLDGRKILVHAIRDRAAQVTLELTDVTCVIEMTLSEHRDTLTGLPNRTALSRALDKISRQPLLEQNAALFYLDLDRFKAINDTLGHPIGDELLKLVTRRVQGLLSSDALFVRLGGDEFAILKRDCAREAAEKLSATVIEKLSRAYLVRGHSLNVGASIGIAMIDICQQVTADELVQHADLALFKAKNEGRGIFRFYNDAMEAEARARRSLEIDLRRALALQEFSLVYQPQFEIDGAKLVGFEALLRWNNDVRGPVSPAEFIPIAEEMALIIPLGDWVLRTACTTAAAWPGSLSISVNLSPVQFRHPNLLGSIVSALANANLSPSRLELEITEGALLEDTDTVLEKLRKIKSLGIKVSMDDFGTGYSSLSYLQKFPFDKIKIDQSFVRSINTNSDSAAIVRAVTALGQSLGMVTIAEGVETPEQLEHIARDGCQQVQGYLTGRPLTEGAAKSLACSSADQG